MPQLRGDVIKERARGNCACAAKRRCIITWTAKLARSRKVLTERGNTGRTEQFTQVRFGVDVVPGTLINARIASHDGRVLLAA